MILKGMVTVFVLCQCFTIGADAYELICTLGGSMSKQTLCDTNIHIENVINVAHLMLAVNSSVNFIFYMMNIDEFKTKFVTVSIISILNRTRITSEFLVALLRIRAVSFISTMNVD